MQVFNNYGAAITAQEFATEHQDNPKFQSATKNNLSMRFYIRSWGFNRVNREFAAEVIKETV